MTLPIFNRSTTEEQLQSAVVETAQFLGWRVFFIPDWVWRLIFRLMRSGEFRRRGKEWARPGFPDLVMVRPPRLVFAELKAHGKDPREDQVEWGDDLRACGVEYYVWRPDDRDDIEPILAPRHRPLTGSDSLS